MIVLNDHRSTDRLYTYRIPEGIEDIIVPGIRVLLPFGKGNRAMIGYVIHCTDQEPSFATKEILQAVDLWPIVSDELIQLAFHLQETTHCNLYRAFKAIGPPGDSKQIRTRFRRKGFDTTFSYEDLLSDHGEQTDDWIRNEIRRQQMQPIYEIESETKPKMETRIRLLLSELPPLGNAHRQAAVLEYLHAHGETAQPTLLRETGAGSQTIKSLASKGWIEVDEVQVLREVVKEVEGPLSEPLPLSKEQTEAFDAIAQQPGGHFLLHGVTGSGKTEIYLQLVEEVLQANRSAIILVPEISLTPQTIQRFTARFGYRIAILHSKLTTAERFEQWKQIQNGEVSIAIGARSAIFAPFDNLGLIVIDEEQESSYKSESHPRYDTYDVALWRAKKNGATLLLGSATPQLRTYADALQGKLKLLTLHSRVRNLPMPGIEIVDMREELRAGNPSIFSRSLRTQMEEALSHREQVVLFLNKRGHSSFVFCRKCGFTKRCDDCDVSMTYHKRSDVLLCHYCGKTAKLPMVCPECGSNAIGHFGTGTEQVESYAKQIFPEARVVRMDADTTSNKTAYDDFYTKMQNKEIDILIGTQMIAKGLDFPGVRVVGIVMADISLNMPDYTANERTFQLVAQVAGRAGRGAFPGTVVLQTYNPTHFAIQTAGAHDFAGFYEKEMRIREHFAYPPYVRMVTIQSVSQDGKAALTALQETKTAVLRFKQARDLDYLTMIGPTPCQIPRIRNKYRYQLTLKVTGHEKELHLIIDWLQEMQYERWAKKDVNIQFYIE